jgi:Rieske 2Fe-2S family protein
MAFWKVTGEQDWKLCEDTQAGVASRFYRPFVYAPVENGPGQFVEWYLQQVIVPTMETRL